MAQAKDNGAAHGKGATEGAAADGASGFLPLPAQKLTPLFKQYLSIKEQHPDAILLYRLGDFYEMFGPDAERAAPILGVVLTAREAARGVKVPMCGVPHHALMRYVKKLVEAGEKVALCDQLEEPAPGKKLVHRGVTRVITAGTLVEDEFLSDDSGVFLLVLSEHRGKAGFCLLEAAGGRVAHTELDLKSSRSRLIAEIERVHPQEMLLDPAIAKLPEFAEFKQRHPFAVIHTFDAQVSLKDAEFFARKFLRTEHLESFGLQADSAVLLSLFHLVRYLRDVFKVEEPKLFLQRISLSERMQLDGRAVRHLELERLEDGNGPREVAAGLLGVLNCARTPMGKRLLTGRLKAPFTDPDTINSYLEAVEELVEAEDAASALGAALGGVSDLERILNRVNLGRTNPPELVKLRESLARLPEIARALGSRNAPLLARLAKELPLCQKPLAQLAALDGEPPAKVEDGGVFRQGCDAELDRLRALMDQGEAWFNTYEEQLRGQTGIRSLKVKRTPAFGWFIEVTKANLHLVLPEHGFERKQTLVGSERFVTTELTTRERELAEAESRALELERRMWEDLLVSLRSQADELHSAADILAEADYVLALADTARREGWARPVVNDSPVIEIKDGVHPLVQRMVGRQRFVPNDVYLDADTVQINLITGPNMGGKSTYMRMAALVVILAQMGGFVPAERAHIGVVDRIFTRMGVMDAVVLGKSTFMVEMVETAEILNNATERSLVIMDEIGRGTSTYDGISIARAVVEFLHSGKRAHPKTLFATHYFELTELAELLPRVRNLKVEVRQGGGELVFLYKVAPGFVDESYGVEVARLAGLPPEVIDRARAVLEELEEVKRESLTKSRRLMQLGLFGEKQ